MNESCNTVPRISAKGGRGVLIQIGASMLAGPAMRHRARAE
jgi:hypothetical protein